MRASCIKNKNFDGSFFFHFFFLALFIWKFFESVVNWHFFFKRHSSRHRNLEPRHLFWPGHRWTSCPRIAFLLQRSGCRNSYYGRWCVNASSSRRARLNMKWNWSSEFRGCKHAIINDGIFRLFREQSLWRPRRIFQPMEWFRSGCYRRSWTGQHRFQGGWFRLVEHWLPDTQLEFVYRQCRSLLPLSTCFTRRLQVSWKVYSIHFLHWG